MRRRSITIVAGIVAIATIAVVASSGSAQGPALLSLHLTGKNQKTVGFGPNHKPRQGDRFGFGDAIKGDDTGVDRGICTVIGKTTAVCTVQVNLAHGTLGAQGSISLTHKNTNNPFTITGGTGDYNGARGTALVTDTSSSTSDIQISLLP